MILVTGGTGLVGSHLLFDLAKKGKKIRALKRKTSNIRRVSKIFSYYSPDSDKLFSNIEWIEGDILDTDSLSVAMKGVKEVYHCAGLVSFLPNKKDIMQKINVQGTKNIINTSLKEGIDKLCYVSSTSIAYSNNNIDKYDENFKWNPSAEHSNYSISKYKAEIEVREGIKKGLNCIIINPSIIIGPGDWTKGSSMLFTKVWKGYSFYTSGTAGFVDVKDVSSAMIKLMQNNDSSIFNKRFIISSENCSYKNIIYWIADSLNKKNPNIYVNNLTLKLAGKFDIIKCKLLNQEPLITKEIIMMSDKKYYYSNEKIKNTININFIPVKDSIKQTGSLFLKDMDILQN